MKFRNDFVTNSSSSSFIVVFNNKKEMNQAFKEMMKTYPEYAVKVFNDIKRNKKTYTEVADFIERKFGWEAQKNIVNDNPEKYKSEQEWKNSRHFNNLKHEYIEKEIDKFEEKTNHKGIFSIVTYTSQTENELEKIIMPKMPFVFETISNHGNEDD